MKASYNVENFEIIFTADVTEVGDEDMCGTEASNHVMSGKP